MPKKFQLIANTAGDTVFFFHCPGCKIAHSISIARRLDSNEKLWTWDGDLENPTVNPSIFIAGNKGTAKYKYKDSAIQCHLILNKGMIYFLRDCDHDLAARTVAMSDW